MLKKLFYFALAFFIIACIIRYFDIRKSHPLSNKSSISEEDIVLNAVKKEPKVKDAFISGVNILFVYVDDDGTRRNGYDDYLCILLRELNVTTHKVKVMEHGSKKNDNYGNQLGESNCK